MLARLIEFSLAQRLLVLVATVLLAGAGLQAWQQLPVDAFPDVSTPQVKLILKAPGMTPEEVEARITIPIEQEMLGIPRERLLRSTSKYALADVTLDFEEGTDVYWARQQVSERLNGVLGNLPPGVSGGLAPITTPLGEMFMFTIEGPLSLAEKRILLDWTLRPAVRTSPPRLFTSATPGTVRSCGRIVQSSRVRFSCSEIGPSMVNMNISPSGVVIGARPPLAPGGRLPITPARRSPTCWRAQ